MSHYTVAVFTKENQTVDEMLEPFDENLEVAPYVRVTKEEYLKEIENYCNKDVELQKKFSNLSEQEKIEKWTGYTNFDKHGNPLTTYNPNSKWDWYSIGGRWSGLLKTKDGHRVDSCLVKDLDLTLDDEAYKDALRYWELVVENKPLKEGEEKPFSFYNQQYYIERYETKENYAKQQAILTTYAILTPDGQWHEAGQMGWWGISFADFDAQKEWDKMCIKLFEEVKPNWRITIVDCHI